MYNTTNTHSVETISEIYRWGINENGFDTSLVVLYLTPEKVMLKALQGKLTRERLRTLSNYLTSRGVKSILYYRLKRGQLIEKNIKLR